MTLYMRCPRISTFIAGIAVAILLMLLVLSLPQLMESIAKIPSVSENIGKFESPITLSIWTNFAIGIAAALAAIEQALMLRSHWLIDMETSGWGIATNSFA
ncbi:hypothetical protein [Oceanobacillus locisalsi]|uniref:Uncharacterized protein n=1 Tax=Oceanobacillus locisalsi TaxID=546107 RepID=A0ABW3NI91_9BACI